MWEGRQPPQLSQQSGLDQCLIGAVSECVTNEAHWCRHNDPIPAELAPRIQRTLCLETRCWMFMSTRALKHVWMKYSALCSPWHHCALELPLVRDTTQCVVERVHTFRSNPTITVLVRAPRLETFMCVLFVRVSPLGHAVGCGPSLLSLIQPAFDMVRRWRFAATSGDGVLQPPCKPKPCLVSLQCAHVVRVFS